MKLVYHGTIAERALQIARDGAILSFECQLVRNIKSFFGKNIPGTHNSEEEFIRRNGKGVEEYISAAISRSEDNRELIRKTTVYITALRNIAEDHVKNGVVLGCEVTPEIEKQFPEGWETTGAIWIPKKFDISTLKHLYMTEPVVDGPNYYDLRHAFNRYHPEFKMLRCNGETVNLS